MLARRGGAAAPTPAAAPAAEPSPSARAVDLSAWPGPSATRAEGGLRPSVQDAPAEGPPSIFNHSRFDHEPVAVAADAFAPQKMLHLVGWPEMRLLPPEQLVPMARICALLAHGPSVGFLVHRRLDLPREDVMALLFRMHGQGLIRVSGGDAVAEEPPPPSEPSAHGSARRAKSSIWTRMLERLLH